MRRSPVVIVLGLMLLLPAMVAGQEPGRTAGGGGTGAPGLYEELTLQEFRAMDEVRAEIDFDAVDYPLLHAAVHFLTNAEREARGLTPLEYAPALERAAFRHSRAMREHGFFSHTSPLAGQRTPADRVRKAGWESPYVGENIANMIAIAYEPGRGLYTPQQNGGYFSYAHQGAPIPPHTYLSAAEEVMNQWMSSPGHRENILRPAYRYLGVGAWHFKDESFHGIDRFYFTQNFGR